MDANISVTNFDLITDVLEVFIDANRQMLTVCTFLQNPLHNTGDFSFVDNSYGSTSLFSA